MTGRFFVAAMRAAAVQLNVLLCVQSSVSAAQPLISPRSAAQPVTSSCTRDMSLTELALNLLHRLSTALAGWAHDDNQTPQPMAHMLMAYCPCNARHTSKSEQLLAVTAVTARQS